MVVSGAVVSLSLGWLIAAFHPFSLVLIRAVKEGIKPGNFAQLDFFRLIIAQDGSERKHKINFPCSEQMKLQQIPQILQSL